MKFSSEQIVEVIELNVLKPVYLTFVAEMAGKTINDSELIVPTLKKLLLHEKAYVREGAIYGLMHHYSDDIKNVFKEIAQNDPSPGVRLAAESAIDECSLPQINYSNREQKEILNNYLNEILCNTKDLPPESQKIFNDNFWELF
jgi:vesicle coat complex subunit